MAPLTAERAEETRMARNALLTMAGGGGVGQQLKR